MSSLIVATAHGPLSQRAFLLHMGLGTRISALRRAVASPERVDGLGEAAARLVNPVRMSKGYKVMGVTAGAASAADTDGVCRSLQAIRENDAAASRAHDLSRDARGVGVGELRRDR